MSVKGLQIILLACLTFCLASISYADNSNDDMAVFQTLFQHWADAFNKKNISASCAIFSPQISADYLGFPTKNYTIICDGFKKIFEEKNREYRYQFKINHIYRSGDLAAVRITWSLDIFENNARISTTKDEGLDILQKQTNGEWQIVNYLSYPISQQGKLIG